MLVVRPVAVALDGGGAGTYTPRAIPETGPRGGTSSLNFGFMSVVWLTPVLTGSFALVGGLGGVVLSSYLASRTDEKRRANEDERRWLVDRRDLYAKYLSLIASMLKSIETASVFMPYDETKPITKEDEKLLNEEMFGLHDRWETEVQFMLGEVQLIALPKVADLADRASWALMVIMGDIDTPKTYREVNAAYYRTLHLVESLRNAMRDELGLTNPVHTWPKSAEWTDWPWLEDKPEELDKNDNASNEDQANKA